MNLSYNMHNIQIISPIQNTIIQCIYCWRSIGYSNEMQVVVVMADLHLTANKHSHFLSYQPVV